MANDPKTTGSQDDSGSFLGGRKFNQAGNNVPLPGEKVSEATLSQGFFGGPRIWLGAFIVIALLGVLYMVYGGGLAGVMHTGGHGGGISSNDRPAVDPDANPNSPNSQ